MKNGVKTFLTPNGVESKLYNNINKFTTNSAESELVFKYAYSKKNIDLDSNQEPIIVNNRFSDGSALYNKMALIEYNTIEKLWKKVDGNRISDFSKEVQFSKEEHKYLGELFTVSDEVDGKFIVTKQGPELVNRKLKAESSNNYGQVMSKVKDFLFSTGVSIQDMDSYLSNNGYRNYGLQGVKGLADTSLRIIALTSENGKTLAEEAAHMAVDFFSNQLLINKTLPKIVNSPLYKENAEHYRKKYKVFGLSEAEVESKVQREILGKYVGQAIEFNTYPKGFRGLIQSIINNIKKIFNPEYKKLAEEISEYVIKNDSKKFEYIPTGDVFFDSSNELIDTIRDSLSQYIRVLKKDRKNPKKFKSVHDMLTAINNASEGEGNDKAGLILFVQTLLEDTQKALSKLEKLSSLDSNKLQDLRLYFSYYRPYVTYMRNNDILPELKEELKKIDSLFSEMDNIKHNFVINEALVHLEPYNKEGVSLRKEFAQMSVDDGFLGKWLASGADSANPIARILHFMITKIMHKVNLTTIDFGRDLLNKAENLGITKTDFLFETVGKRRTGNFVRPTDLNFKTLPPNQKEFIIYVEKLMTTMYRQIGLKYKGLAPQMSASMLDVAIRANENTFKSLKLIAQDSILSDTQDDVGFYKSIGSRPDGSSERLVPRYYTKKLDNPDTITNDALSSIIAFKKMAENYDVMSNSAPVFENILEALRGSKFVKGKELKNASESNTASKMETMIQMFVYGEESREIKEMTFRGKKYSVAKILSKIKNYVTSNNLANSFFTQAAGYISARVFLKLDSFLEEHSSSKSQSFARKTLPKYYSQAIAEIGVKNKKSKLNIIMQDLGIFGDSSKIFENLNKNWVTRFSANSPFMSGFALANYSIKAKVMFAALDHYRLYNDKIIKPNNPNYSKAKPLHEYLLNGKKIGSTSAKHKDNMAYIGMIVENQVATFEGSMSNSDRTAAQQSAIVNLTLTHKSWLVRGFSKRFRKEGYNYILDKEDVGYMRAAGGFFLKAFNSENINMFRYLIDSYPALPLSKQVAVKKALLEFGMVTSLVVVASILNNMFEDEDEGPTPYMLYLFNRSYLELSALSAPFGIPEVIGIIKNPLVATGQMQQFMDLTNMFNTEEVKQGPFEGFNKGQKAVLKLFPGVKGYFSSSDPTYSNRWLKQGPLAYSLYFQK